jgi:hypothetical protein
MKEHKTLLASAVVLGLVLSSFAAAERPPQCDEAETAIRALGVEPGDLAQIEFSRCRLQKVPRKKSKQHLMTC